jgi:hypothetical protein
VRKTRITAVSDPKMLLDLKEELDAFIIKNNENPFLLPTFLAKQMESPSVKRSTPKVLIIRNEDSIVGVLPLLIEKKFGFQFARFLLNVPYSPDFIFDYHYREVCMESCLNFIFGFLHCLYAHFSLPVESKNFDLIKLVAAKTSVKIQIKVDESFNHAIMMVENSWEDFQKLKGKHFSKTLRQLERRMENSGNIEIQFFENAQSEEEVFLKIMDVEKSCWKHNWRVDNDVQLDEDLINIWTWSCLAIRTYEGFKRRVCFLNLDGKVIAYNLAIEYKGTAYMCKTSFNNEYRKLNPGIFVINMSIRDSFDSGNVSRIDFMTNLPFHKRWTRMCLFRVEVLLVKGILPKLLVSIVRQPKIRLIMRRFV